jgi:endoglucanase
VAGAGPAGRAARGGGGRDAGVRAGGRARAGAGGGLRRATVLLAVLLAAAAAATIGGCGGGGGGGGGPAAPATPAASARAFLDRYVDPDGRVARRDQGGDTVSEGQAYALLVAVAVDDRATFARVWRWSTAHLARDDGLLSWRPGDGQSAADADLDAAHALELAADRWRRPDYARASRRIADAMRGAEIRDGVIVAGPWAKDQGVTNPSYFDPRALEALHMDDVADATRAALAGVWPADAPPDWATLGAPGTPAAASGPPGGGDGGPSYGYDAARVPIRLAASCDPADRRVAASFTGLESRAPSGHPVFLVARAAAAKARGDGADAAALLDDAARRDVERPTYYGAAWVALGRLLLQSDRLGSCPGR